MTTRSFRWVDSAGIERTVTEDELRAQLASGTIPRSSLVCEVPGDAWVHAEELDGIGPPPSTAFVPPPPPFVEDVQRAFEGKLAPSEAPPAPLPPPKSPARALAGGTLIGGMVSPPPPPRVAPSAPPPRAMAGGTLVGMAPPAYRTGSVPPPSIPPLAAPRRALLPIVIGAVGVIALIGVVAIGRSVLSSPPAAPSTAAVVAIASAPPGKAVVATPPPAETARPAQQERATACKIAKGPARLALRASKDVPIELAGVPAKGTVALGFSPEGRTARGLAIDPQSLLAKPELPPVPRGFVRHVTPVPTQTGVKWLVDADLPKAAVAPTLSVPVEPAYAVGIADGALVLVGAPGEAPRKLWTLPGAVDAMRALPLADAGALIALRAEGGVYVGRIGTDRSARGDLTLVSPPGQVGAPALGTNGVDVAIAFAWRAGGSDPWTLRLAHGGRSDALAVASAFELPKGGPGGDAFAPSLAGLSDGRWLLAWTEGATGSRAVRAITLSSSAVAFGDPLVLSAGITSAGQGSVAVVGGDTGLAVFLTTTKLGLYDLWGTSLSCSLARSVGSPSSFRSSSPPPACRPRARRRTLPPPLDAETSTGRGRSPTTSSSRRCTTSRSSSRTYRTIAAQRARASPRRSGSSRPLPRSGSSTRSGSTPRR